MHNSSLCIFGEVLFDCFPDARRILGGAPFNVAWHLSAFGARPRFMSAVGNDADGSQIRASMDAWGMSAADLQTDMIHATGRVEVKLERGEPSYDIVPDCAYDYIRAPPGRDLECALLYHGTLALRQPISAATLAELKRVRPELTFLDVNLRAPWWNRTEVLALITDADWVKLNRDELLTFAATDVDPSQPMNDARLAELAEAFLDAHHLRGLLVTLGAAGALGLTVDQAPVRVAPVPALQVVDTVGAGDAFAAVCILGILNGWPLAITLERAQTFASAIVGQRGATVSERSFYHPFSAQWDLPIT